MGRDRKVPVDEILYAVWREYPTLVEIERTEPHPDMDHAPVDTLRIGADYVVVGEATDETGQPADGYDFAFYCGDDDLIGQDYEATPTGLRMVLEGWIDLKREGVS